LGDYGRQQDPDQGKERNRIAPIGMGDALWKQESRPDQSRRLSQSV
jgi:hypothetical protein